MAQNTDSFTSAFMQKIDGELLCGICLEFFKCPILLPCGHNFCRDCIQGIVDNPNPFDSMCVGIPSNDSFHCPVCQKTVHLQRGGLFSHLPENRALESIVRLYKDSSPVGIFDAPLMRDLEITADTCAVHNLPEDLFCEICNVTVCGECVRLKHAQRTGKHTVQSVKQCATTYQAKAADVLTELKKQMILLTDRIKLFEEMMSQIKVNSDYVMKQLDERVGSLHAYLRCQHEQLKQQITHQSDAIQKPVDDELHKCQNMRITVIELMKTLPAIRKMKNSTTKLKMLKNFGRQLDELMRSDLRWCLQSSNIPDVEALTLVMDIQPQIDSIAEMTLQQTNGLSRVKKCEVSTQTVEQIEITTGYTLPRVEQMERQQASQRGQVFTSPGMVEGTPVYREELKLSQKPSTLLDYTDEQNKDTLSSQSSGGFEVADIESPKVESTRVENIRTDVDSSRMFGGQDSTALTNGTNRHDLYQSQSTGSLQLKPHLSQSTRHSFQSDTSERLPFNSGLPSHMSPANDKTDIDIPSSLSNHRSFSQTSFNHRKDRIAGGRTPTNRRTDTDMPSFLSNRRSPNYMSPSNHRTDTPGFSLSESLPIRTPPRSEHADAIAKFMARRKTLSPSNNTYKSDTLGTPFGRFSSKSRTPPAMKTMDDTLENGMSHLNMSSANKRYDDPFSEVGGLGLDFGNIEANIAEGLGKLVVDGSETGAGTKRVANDPVPEVGGLGLAIADSGSDRVKGPVGEKSTADDPFEAIGGLGLDFDDRKAKRAESSVEVVSLGFNFDKPEDEGSEDSEEIGGLGLNFDGINGGGNTSKEGNTSDAGARVTNDGVAGGYGVVHNSVGTNGPVGFFGQWEDGMRRNVKTENCNSESAIGQGAEGTDRNVTVENRSSPPNRLDQTDASVETGRRKVQSVVNRNTVLPDRNEQLTEQSEVLNRDTNNHSTVPPTSSNVSSAIQVNSEDTRSRSRANSVSSSASRTSSVHSPTPKSYTKQPLAITLDFGLGPVETATDRPRQQGDTKKVTEV